MNTKILTIALVIVTVSSVMAIADEAFTLQLPVGGVEGRDWVLGQYVDLDRTSGLRDYRGGRKTYDNHNGVDFTVPNFRWMDQGFPIFASYRGEIIQVIDGFTDRNMPDDLDFSSGCASRNNRVAIQHPNGFRTHYYHLKRNSVVVKVGQKVKAGQQIALMGSSGCSTTAHLHFEVRNASGHVVDPFRDSLWADPPAYDTPITIMDLMVTDRAVTRLSHAKDPGENITTIKPRSTMGVAVSVAGMRKGSKLRFTVQNESTRYGSNIIEMDQDYTHSYWAWNFDLRKSSGTWRVSVYLDGKKLDISHEVQVVG